MHDNPLEPEVNLQWLNNPSEKEKLLALLKEEELEYLIRLEWTPNDTGLKLLKLITRMLGPPSLLQLGHQLSHQASFAANVTNIRQALTNLDAAYYKNYQVKEEIGHYFFTQIDEHCAQIISTTPYSCEIDRGVIEAICHRFKPPETVFVLVEHLYHLPCRAKGGQSCTYVTTWIDTQGHNPRFEKLIVVPSVRY